MSTRPARDPYASDPYTSDPARPLASAAGPWWRWLFLVPGFAALAWGAVGLLRDDRVPLPAWLTWFIGSALVHDFVVAPLVIGIGAVLARLLPGPARPPVVVGLVVSGFLTLVALPFILDRTTSREPGFLPLDYGRNLLLLIAAIMAVAVVWGLVASVLAGRSRAGRSQAG